MIPAGYEKKKSFDFYDSDEEDDGFVFDFTESNMSKNPTFEDTCLDDVTTSQNPNTKQNCGDQMVYKVNKEYFYDETKYLLEDLQHAIIRRNLQQVKDLFEKHNFDVNVSMKPNWTPIMYAVSCGSYEITEYLIDSGADIFFQDDSFSVLLCASGCIDSNVNPANLVKIVKLLINKGVQINSCDKYLQTSLMYACRSNNLLLVASLIELGANIDAQDDNDWTALSHASSKGHLKCVHKLLQLGADPTIYTYDYLYPFDLAQNSGHNEVKDLIKRFIRVKKIENIKKNVTDAALSEISVDDGFESFEEDDECGFNQKGKSSTQDLETFLNALNLNNTINNFRSNNITMIELLNFDDADLKTIGITDSYARELILYEAKRFHQKNWRSSSLIPIRKDFSINCNEVIAIVSNLSRHTDYMSTNIKYISRETNKSNSDLFADKFLNSRLSFELKKTLSHTRQLLQNVQSYSDYVEKYTQDKNAVPMDSVDNCQPKPWFSKPLKLAVISSIGITCVASAMYYLKKG